jgi:hypothetical protein
MDTDPAATLGKFFKQTANTRVDDGFVVESSTHEMVQHGGMLVCVLEDLSQSEVWMRVPKI